MYNLSEDTKKLMSKTMGVPYENIVKTEPEDLATYIEQKHGKKPNFSKPHTLLSGSGDDSILIDHNRITTMDSIDKRLNKIAKHSKLKHNYKHTAYTSNQEDVLSK